MEGVGSQCAQSRTVRGSSARGKNPQDFGCVINVKHDAGRGRGASAGRGRGRDVQPSWELECAVIRDIGAKAGVLRPLTSDGQFNPDRHVDYCNGCNQASRRLPDPTSRLSPAFASATMKRAPRQLISNRTSVPARAAFALDSGLAGITNISRYGTRKAPAIQM
jgi:hypothetical protein